MVNNKIKLSVIVPVYNTEEYLCRCVDSLLDQTYSLIEIILVDDGSTDSSGKKCDLYELKDPRIKVIHKTNGGQMSARKAGVRAATGDYISYLDSDDWIESNAYEVLVAKLNLYRPDVLTYGLTKDYESGLSIKRTGEMSMGIYSSDQFWEEMNQAVENSYFYCQAIVVNAVTKIIKSRLLKDWQKRIDDTVQYGEDNVLTYWAMTHAKTIYVESGCFYHYCVRKGSTCWNRKNNNFALCVKALRAMKYAYDDSGSENKMRQHLVDTAYYLLSIFCMKDCFERNGKLILFPDIPRNSKIVLYGKGVFANQFLECIRKTGYLTIIDNVDSKDVKKIRDISSETYDYIVIGIAEPSIIKEAIQILMKMGIEKSQIRHIDKKNLSIDKLPIEIKSLLMTDS